MARISATVMIGVAGALLVGLVGCHHPLNVNTRSVVDVANPLRGTVSLAVANPSSEGPLVEMTLDGRPLACDRSRIALLDVDGLLLNQNLNGPLLAGDNPVALFREKLDAAGADPAVRAVVVRINSPGGGVTATDSMWQDLRRFKAATGKPVVVCMMDVATGGAYYLATAADHIAAHPTTITGGIGVIWNGYNLRDLMAVVNILPQSVKAGQNIDMGTGARPLSPEAKKLLQQIADEFHERFKSVVTKARTRIDPQDASLFDGQVMTAAKARAAGLIDSIGYLDDALDVARSLANAPKAPAVMYHRRSDPVRTPYAISAHVSPMAPLIPISFPGLERSRLPTFLYLWQPEPSLDNR